MYENEDDRVTDSAVLIVAFIAMLVLAIFCGVCWVVLP